MWSGDSSKWELWFKQWLKPSRLIPSLTILAAGVAVVLSLFKVIVLSLAEDIIIALLGFLAADALIERLGLLEKVESRLGSLIQRFGAQDAPFLQSRKDLARFPETAQDAKDIFIIACSASGILTEHTQFFIDRVKQGARIRLAVVNPDENAVVEIVGRSDIMPVQTQIADMRTAAGVIEHIGTHIPNTHLFEVRVFDYVPTLSFVMIDGDLPTGRISAELYLYQIDPWRRPHFLVTAKDHPDWYSYFRDICEAIWQNAKVPLSHLPAIQ
jgi:hypothetical protein